mmetsp:Transcript_12704/g.12777  ORF Transcript_12704/g.12777 Transcript_12704/m.12777 type:complete len:153 (-) Transcript_12704:567-1025(-)
MPETSSSEDRERGGEGGGGGGGGGGGIRVLLAVLEGGVVLLLLTVVEGVDEFFLGKTGLGGIRRGAVVEVTLLLEETELAPDGSSGFTTRIVVVAVTPVVGVAVTDEVALMFLFGNTGLGGMRRVGVIFASLLDTADSMGVDKLLSIMLPPL